MADEARVRSVESREFFRSALIVFLYKARIGLGHAEDAVKRGRYWVEQEQHNHWVQEFKKRSRKLAQAQQELLSAKLSTFKDSAMLQEKMMRRAKEAVVEAEEKMKNVKKWIREYDRLFDAQVKGLGHLSDYLEHDMPASVAWLEQALRSLASYLERERPSGGPRPAAPDADALPESTSPSR
jgi:acyl transferase domain-containing protein